MKENPCKLCVAPKRYPGCHSKCKEYIDWKAEHDRLRDEERTRKQTEYYPNKRRFSYGKFNSFKNW